MVVIAIPVSEDNIGVQWHRGNEVGYLFRILPFGQFDNMVILAVVSVGNGVITGWHVAYFHLLEGIDCCDGQLS
jgi:hypothetical protein